MLLKDKVAIVTGASRGIGRAVAITFARNGASVIIHATNEEKLNELADEIATFAERPLIFAGDVTDVETSRSTVSMAGDRFGRVDILVNNAGINMRSSTLDMRVEDWKRVLDINLNGTLYFCQAVLPSMIEQGGGRIINVSSTTAKTAHRNAAPSYGASKAAVNYLTMHLALEMASHNILVNAICPGPVETDMSEQWSEEYRQKVVSAVPLKRLGTPQNVADIALFLASDMSSFITGESINANGGTYMN